MLNIIEINGCRASINEKAFVAEGVYLIGDILIGEGASIWFNCVLRADNDKIVIGKCSNIQDGSVVHTEIGLPTVVGDYVTVGHGAILHACTIRDNSLIGMGAIILDGAEIGEGSIVAAGALVTSNTKIPPNSLVVGTPGKVVKELNPEDQKLRIEHALRYENDWKTRYKKV
ncbi:MAG: gamma carbonic anhydrase family protein [Bacillota bacterium]